MLARKCDRCGVLYEFYADFPDGGNQIGFMKSDERDSARINKTKQYDLCPDCMGKAVRFLKGEDNLDDTVRD